MDEVRERLGSDAAAMLQAFQVCWAARPRVEELDEDAALIGSPERAAERRAIVGVERLHYGVR
jgi:hypothetical protein